MNKDLFAYILNLSMDAHPSKWFRLLNKSKLNDWDYIIDEFDEYRYNAQLSIGLLDLELTKENPNDDFVTFFTRWRERPPKRLICHLKRIKFAW